MMIGVNEIPERRRVEVAAGLRSVRAKLAMVSGHGVGICPRTGEQSLDPRADGIATTDDADGP